jgi:hypothetical protein
MHAATAALPAFAFQAITAFGAVVMPGWAIAGLAIGNNAVAAREIANDVRAR